MSTRNPTETRTPALLVDWRQVETERGRLVWEGLTVAVFIGWSGGDWSIHTSWQRASFLAQLDPRADVELEAHRQPEVKERPTRWLAGQALPQPCWLDLRSSTDAWAPRTPALLIERRPRPNGAEGPVADCLAVTARREGDAGMWVMEGRWYPTPIVHPIKPLADRELRQLRTG